MSQSKQSAVTKSKSVEVAIPSAVLKLRDKFQALGYRTTFSQYHVEPLKRKIVNTEYLSDMPAVYHVHGGTIVFEPGVEGISTATLFHPLSATPIVMHFYDETGEFRDACMYGQLEGVETIAVKSFEEIFADFPADSAFWGDEEKQKELLSARRPQDEFKLVEKPMSRAELFAKWQAEQAAALALTGDVEEPQLDTVATAELQEQPTEDADLNKIADEREGQTDVPVDVESL